MDTAQNQNTNNAQFAYPDFSQSNGNLAPVQTPTPTPPTPQVQTPAPSQPVPNNLSVPPVQPVSPVPAQPIATAPVEPKQDYVDPQKLEELKKDIDALLDTPVTTQEENEGSYVQQPTELPNLQTPPELPKQQIFSDSLNAVMPGEKVIKAMQRDEKPNNLTQPINIVSEPPAPDKAKVITIAGLEQEFSMDALLSEVIKRSASDLHLSPGHTPVIRLDGELVDVGEKILTAKDTEELILSMMPDDKKEILEVNREVDFAYSFDDKNGVAGRFRINAFHAMKHISAALRLIPTRVKTIEELNLPPVYHQITKLKQGLVLVTGPTGHGKSTTLAAMLEDINRNRFDHMITIEDPIEYIFEGKKALIDQREMSDDTNSWGVALRSAMRQDPDVILVGEMRDYETISAAITLAETGHLVFATLHTNSAAQTIDRVIDVFPENQQPQVRSQLANILQVVIAQRLIPLDRGGRRAVSEIMFNTPAVANLIREGKTFQIDNVIRTGVDAGMVYLEKGLVSLVREGAISSQKAQEYAVHPEEVIRLLKG